MSVTTLEPIRANVSFGQINVVLMTLVGGMGTVFGPIVGALVMVVMQNTLAHLGAWIVIVQGTIFVVVVLIFREGIVGMLSKWLKREL